MRRQRAFDSDGFNKILEDRGEVSFTDVAWLMGVSLERAEELVLVVSANPLRVQLGERSYGELDDVSFDSDWFESGEEIRQFILWALNTGFAGDGLSQWLRLLAVATIHDTKVSVESTPNQGQNHTHG